MYTVHVPGSAEAPLARTFYSRVRTESEAARSLPCSLPPAPGLTATAVDDAAADATPGGGAEAVRVEPSTVLASCGAGLVGPAVFDARSLATPSLWVISCPGWRGPSQVCWLTLPWGSSVRSKLASAPVAIERAPTPRSSLVRAQWDLPKFQSAPNRGQCASCP